jgi:hypothetical protein
MQAEPLPSAGARSNRGRRGRCARWPRVVMMGTLRPYIAQSGARGLEFLPRKDEDLFSERLISSRMQQPRQLTRNAEGSRERREDC